MGYIYKITNLINGKIYVGQTTQTIARRWWSHKQEAFQTPPKSHSKLHNAIRKYGADSFTIEIIEECNNSLLDDREIYWIEALDAIRTGYNILIGGSGKLTFDERQKREILAMWDKGMTMAEIRSVIKHDHRSISKILYDSGVTKEEVIARREKIVGKAKSKPVYMYSLDGNFIKGFASGREAEKAVGIPRDYISSIANGNGGTGLNYGVTFRFFKTDSIEPVVHKQKVEVHQYSLEGEYIATYPSLGAASKSVGVNDSSLCSALKRGRGTAGGYQWRTERFDKIAPTSEPICTPKAVHQYNLDGKYICSYPSITAAKTAMGIASSSPIMFACRGKNKTSCGYRWSFDKCASL